MKNGFSLITVLISIVIVAMVGAAALFLIIEAIKNERYAVNLHMAVNEWSVERVVSPCKLKVVGVFYLPPLKFRKLSFSVSGFEFKEVSY